MAYTYYKHATIDRFNPMARAICDRCGLTWNHRDLRPQYDWAGPKLRSTGFLVCPNCMDKPQEQLRQIILPADPIPVVDPRLEPNQSTINSGLWIEGQATIQWLLTEAGFLLSAESQDTPTPSSSGVIYDWMASS